MKQVRVIKEPPRNNREVCKDVLNAAGRKPDQPCIQFRHDDDDAVAVDFIEKMRQAARDSRPLMKKHRTVGLDWNHGYVAEVGADGISATEMYRNYYVAALGVHIAGNCTMTIHNFMHERIPRFMPCVTYNDPAMFVRTHNGYNDSRQKQVKEVPVAPLTPEQTALFQNRFAIDADHVTSVFGR